MKTHNKFLSFNGKTIYFTAKDGENHIAIKPICEALGVNYNRQFQNLKEDDILSSVFAKQQMQVLSENGVLQSRKMICLPEKYIYGWLFSIKSNSKELSEYKRTCYELLYNHFHGIITGRRELLQEKRTLQTEIAEIKEALKVNPQYNRLISLEMQDKTTNKRLKNLDVDLVEQPKLF